jgi:hypothetical protein
MRTAIYVYGPSSTSQVGFAMSADAAVLRYVDAASETKADYQEARWMLSPGIYKVTSEGPVTVTPDQPVDYDIVAVVNDKDPWPDPPARFVATFSGVGVSELRAFLNTGMGGFA